MEKDLLFCVLSLLKMVLVMVERWATSLRHVQGSTMFPLEISTAGTSSTLIGV